MKFKFRGISRHFTVFHYDRRGRGDSTDTQPYAVDREVEDIDALIRAAGGSAFISGISTGAILALQAAARLGNKVKKIALYEAPYNYRAEATGQELSKFRKNFRNALAGNLRGEAVDHFLNLLGIPEEQIPAMHQLSVWPDWEAIAHTLWYDVEFMGADGSVPENLATRISVPALIMNGAASPLPMHDTAATLAKVIPDAQHLILEGQDHQVPADALAPVLAEFFNHNKP